MAYSASGGNVVGPASASNDAVATTRSRASTRPALVLVIFVVGPASASNDAVATTRSRACLFYY